MDTLFDDAVEAYRKYCKKNLLIYSQPSDILSEIRSQYVYLANINGRLARYEIKTGEILVP